MSLNNNINGVRVGVVNIPRSVTCVLEFEPREFYSCFREAAWYVSDSSFEESLPAVSF